jgi:hypothetical protein
VHTARKSCKNKSLTKVLLRRGESRHTVNIVFYMTLTTMVGNEASRCCSFLGAEVRVLSSRGGQQES